MPQTVSCVLPVPLVEYLTKTYGQPAFAVLLRAVKSYLNVHTAQEGSVRAAELARANQTTKSDIYRDALISFDPRVRKFWPVPPSTRRGAVKRSNKLTRIPPVDSAELSSLAAIARKLQELQNDLPGMSTTRVAERLQTVIRKVRVLESQIREVRAPT